MKYGPSSTEGTDLHKPGDAPLFEFVLLMTISLFLITLSPKMKIQKMKIRGIGTGLVKHKMSRGQR